MAGRVSHSSLALEDCRRLKHAYLLALLHTLPCHAPPLPHCRASPPTLGILVIQCRSHILRHIGERDTMLRQRAQALLARLQPVARASSGVSQQAHGVTAALLRVDKHTAACSSRKQARFLFPARKPAAHLAYHNVLLLEPLQQRGHHHLL